MPSIIARGNALPSSPHRDANTLYVGDRSVAALRALGIDANVVAMAERGDQLLDNTTSTGEAPRADGVVTIGELDRLDEAQNQAALFPHERAAVASVHKLFAVPDETTVTFAPIANLKYSLERTLTSPAVNSVRIADLPAAQQTAAQRVQLVNDSDSDPATITRADIAWALAPANIGRFTQATVDTLRAINDNFHDDIFAERVVGTLPPASQARTVVEAQGVKVEVDTRIGFKTVSSGRSGVYAWNPQVASRSLVVEAPPGFKVLVKATAQVGTNVGFFEQVVVGNGTRQSLGDVAGISQGNASLWVQIFDPSGALVSNSRVRVPRTEPEAFSVDANVRGKKVAEWRDTAGNVVPHRNNDRGIPGYSVDGHPHLFDREMIYTTI